MTGKTILVIEDDPAIREGLADALTFRGCKVVEAADGDAGLESALRMDYDLMLLDLILPRRSGLEILRELRATRPTIPVIILTAMGDEAGRVRGLESGADDYVVKPFGVKELLARIQAVLRRSPERPTDVKEIRIAEGKIDLARREIRFDDGKQVELSEREADICRHLACNPGRVVTRDELMARVWRIAHRGSATRTVDMHVARLREKLRDDPTEPRIIQTVRGKGYRFGGKEPDS
jgi:DNA-binding response OmpR family regulator